MKIIVYIWGLVILLFSSCIATKEINRESLLGKYEWKEYHVGSDITLNADSTFGYNWYAGLNSGLTEGKWNVRKDNLILNSEKQLKKEPKFIVTPLQKINISEFRVQAMDIDSKDTLIFLTCVLMKRKKALFETSSDINGVCRLPFHKEAKKINFNYTGYYESEVFLDQLESNSFILEMRHGWSSYQYFTEKKWKIKNDRLYSPEVKRDKHAKKNYYQKVKE